MSSPYLASKKVSTLPPFKSFEKPKDILSIIGMSQPTPIDIADGRYEEILTMQGISIQTYRGKPPARPLFPTATVYPEFFNENLVSPYRIIKEFLHDPHGNIRVLYFQLLRLSYEVEPSNSDYRGFIVNLRRMVFAPEFQIMFTPETESQRDIFSDFQFKKFFAEFLVIMEKSTNVLVQEIINRYPIIDLVFIHIFRSLLAARGINEPFEVKIPTETVFGQFAEPLGLNITSYGNCWKFEDSDMFCFEEDEEKLYLAYIVEGGEAQTEVCHIEQKAGSIPVETIKTTVTQTTAYVAPSTTTYTAQTRIPTTTYTATSYAAQPITTTTYTSYTSDPLVAASYTTTVPQVTASYHITPAVTSTHTAVTTAPAATSSYTFGDGAGTGYIATSYIPATEAYEVTATYTSPTTTYQSISYTSPVGSYTSESYTSSSSYSSSQPYTSSYDYKPLLNQVIDYTATSDHINSLVDKYLSGNIEAEITVPSYSTSYTTYEEKVPTPATKVQYISYTPITEPIEIKYGGARSPYQPASYVGPYSTTYTSDPIKTTYQTTTDYGLGGGYLGSTSTSNYSYQPSSYTTSSSAGSSSNYQSYGQYSSDFSNNDILNIMKRGTGTTGAGGAATTTTSGAGGITSSYTTGPATTVSPAGVSTYEYSSSYHVEPPTGGYNANSSSSSYSASYSSGAEGYKY